MEETTPSHFQHTPRRSKKRLAARILLSGLLLLLFAGIGFGAMRFLGSNQTAEPAVVSPTPTPDVFPSEVPLSTPTVPVSPTQTATPTPAAINPVDKATGLDRSNLSVAVQNGSGIVGAASKMSDVLKNFGYHVVSVGNADNFSYQDITIVVKGSVSKYLPLLKSDIAKQFTVASASATLSASASADAVVIIGK